MGNKDQKTKKPKNQVTKKVSGVKKVNKVNTVKKVTKKRKSVVRSQASVTPEESSTIIFHSVGPSLIQENEINESEVIDIPVYFNQPSIAQRTFIIVGVTLMSLVIGLFWYKVSLGYYKSNPVDFNNDPLIKTTTEAYNQIKDFNK